MRFTNLSNNATAFKWNFGDGTTSRENEPSHTYTAAGTFTVTLTATSPDGGSLALERSITVQPRSPISPPAGLVSWWPGDGNANDIVGDNHGTLENGATFATGKVNQAFSFDGTGLFT